MASRKRKQQPEAENVSLNDPYSTTTRELQNLEAANKKRATIAETDLVLVVAQFLKELKYFETLKCLEQESLVPFVVTEDKNRIVNAARERKWTVVLQEMKQVSLSPKLVAFVHEQIILDLCLSGDHETAKAIFLKSNALSQLKEGERDRYNALIQTIQQKQKVREGLKLESDKLARLLEEELVEAQPSELLRLIGDACKWKKLNSEWPSKGLISRTTARRAKTLIKQVEEERASEDTSPASKCFHSISFGSSSYAEHVAFSPDGTSVVTGSVDGFVELWNPSSGKLRTDLEYQKNEALLMHRDAVLCLTFSTDSKYLASGCKAGSIKVWDVQTGKCVKKIKGAHKNGVLSIKFVKEQIVSGGYDQLVKVFGMQSGIMLKELRGHSSYVNSVAVLTAPKQVVLASGSGDATVRIWNMKTSDCLKVIKLKAQSPGDSLSVTKVIPTPNGEILVCNRSSALSLLDPKKNFEAIKEFKSPQQEEFISATIDVRGGNAKFVYGATREKSIHCFEFGTGKLVKSITIEDGNEIIGIEHHPSKKMISVITLKGPMKLII